MAVGLLVVALSGCARRHRKRAVAPPPPAAPATAAPSSGHPSPRRAPPAPAAVGYTETGLASWYGHPFHGRKAANGETYDMETLVAAHRTLPFNTWVRVVNLTNTKTVEVRIIDRGPFVDGRIIDLSHRAAGAIDLIGPGVGPVRMVVVRAPQVVTPGFAVQVGAFRNRDNAERFRAQMAARYGSARLISRPKDAGLWRVLVGMEPTEAGATALADRMRSETGEKNAFVVRLDTE